MEIPVGGLSAVGVISSYMTKAWSFCFLPRYLGQLIDVSIIQLIGRISTFTLVN